MASSRIKGITVEIGANTVPLTEALQKVDRSLKSTQDQLKDVNKLLKFDPKNTELLRQKQELLGSAINETKEKLKAEKEALQQLVAKSDGSDEAIKQQNALKREIEDTAKMLKNYKQQLDQIPTTLDTLSDAAGKAAEKTKALSAVSLAGLTGLVGMAVSAGQTADDLNTLAKQTGFTTEELQKMQYASEMIDVDMNTITSSAAKLTKQIASGNDYFEQLGVALTDASGNTRAVNDIFYDTIEALSHIENETDRDVIAMSLFGKGANELAGIVDDGGQALREYGQEAADMGLILSQDALDGANAFNDGLDKLKAQIKATMFESGSALAENFLPALEKLTEVAGKVLEVIANMDSDTLTLITTILLLGTAVSPVLKLISTGLSTANNLNMLLGSMGGKTIPSLATAVSGASATATASLGTVLPVLAAIAAAATLVIGLIQRIKQTKLNNEWDNYLGSTSGMTQINATQAANWMNSNEVQTIKRPDGSSAYYVRNSDYSYEKGMAAQNGWTDEFYWGQGTNMTVNVDHINDLEDLLEIQRQAQLTTRMG